MAGIRVEWLVFGVGAITDERNEDEIVELTTPDEPDQAGGYLCSRRAAKSRSTATASPLRSGRGSLLRSAWLGAGHLSRRGKSARVDDLGKRPAFKQLLADVERRSGGCLVVHKLDRFARNRRVAFDAFERLSKAGVGFVSLQEHLDYSTAAGQLMLTMLVGLAQFYSDNLSGETKKGKRERKAQGLYNGLLPFGVTKGPEGLPILDQTIRHDEGDRPRPIVPAAGLQFAFELAAAGKSDREIAKALNAAGYRTSGNRGANLFSKDTVRRILTNRFYVGELPDGQGGWVPGRHGPLIDERCSRRRSGRGRRIRVVLSGSLPMHRHGPFRG